jgi:hypothetical protein
MKLSRFTEQQIAFALQQAEQGTQVAEVNRKMRDHRADLLPQEEKVWRADALGGEEAPAENLGVVSWCKW